MRLRRTLLFMPGDSRRKIEKGAVSGADSIIMDLEDGVALNAKAVARQEIASALREVDFGSAEKLVRINAVSRDHMPEEDLLATLDFYPDGYVIPKVEAAWQLTQVSRVLSAAEHRLGREEGSFVLLAIIETALGVINIREICENSPRLVALIFGAEDFAGDMGAIRTPGGAEVAYARASVVLHAKAFGLGAIDGVYLTLDDEEGLTRETTAALQMGYTGKLAIHPRQIDPITKVFTPTDAQIRDAVRIIRAHDEHQRSGTGAFALDGKMVDMPIVRAAQTILDRARAAGIQVDLSAAADP